MPMHLFTPYRLGHIELRSRIVMAPMTRQRADSTGTPGDLAVTYYAQRATAGLIITEGTQPSAAGKAYPGVPGLHDDAQEAGWRRVCEAVHEEGGRIFLQQMHAGRASHPLNQPDRRRPVAPSAVTPTGQQVFTPEGFQPFVEPQALEVSELASVQQEYAASAQRAIRAGFDGVELHGGNGYLLQQFLAPNSNQRTDAYGGSPINRIRFVVETAEAVAGAIGADRVGLKITPSAHWNDIAETDAHETYDLLIKTVAPMGLAYLHVGDPAPEHGYSAVDFARDRFPGTLIANSGFGNEIMTGQAAEQILADGRADLVAFGRLFLANPDLPMRLKLDAPLNDIDESTFYSPGASGYTDYPFLDVDVDAGP